MKKYILTGLITLLAIACVGCGKQTTTNGELVEFKDYELTLESSLDLEYATLYSVDFYEDGYVGISVKDEDYYLVVPDDSHEIKAVRNDVTVIPQNITKAYIVGTGQMDYFTSAGAIDQISYTSLQPDDWYLDDVKQAMNAGDIRYAGKYSAPDFEMLLDGGCDFILENVMITHTPEVLQQLRELGFPVLIDYSSYEDSVLGRMEWIKLYGIITGHYDTACEVFEEQKSYIENIDNIDTDITVGFFSITQAGTVSVRKSNDYVCNMIRLAGGKYAFEDILDAEGTGNTTIQMEAFYEMAKDCDVLIYNSTIEGELKSIDDLTSKCELLANCKAVQNGKVFCTNASFYQSVMDLGYIVDEINKLLLDQDDLEHFYRVQ